MSFMNGLGNCLLEPAVMLWACHEMQHGVADDGACGVTAGG